MNTYSYIHSCTKLIFSLALWSSLFLTSLVSHAQNSNINVQIDSLFSEWDNSDEPGLATVVLYQGKVVYKKAFGLANLDSKSPITVNTSFQTAGLSKHFTAFAIFLLEEQGKLSLTDDVRKYVPNLPEFGKVITINHLLSHSSGLQGYWPLKMIAGWRDQDVFTHADALDLIYKQQRLDFEPGQDYSYNNTNLTVLAEVISKASGQSLAEYTKENLFDPLGMVNTYFLENHAQLKKNTATPYQRNGEEFTKGISNLGNAGPTNLYTSVEDMGRWLLNFETPRVGTTALIKKMDEAVQFDNGQTYNPPSGILTYGQQFQHMERGVPKIYQTGGLGGYSSSIFKFTDQKFTSVVLSNNGMPYNGYLAMQTAGLFIEEDYKQPPSIDFSTIKTKKLSSKKLLQFEGSYWNRQGGYVRRVFLREDTLRYARVGSTRESNIVPLGTSTFQMMNTRDDEIIVKFTGEGKSRQMLVTISGSDPLVSDIFEPITYTAKELTEFTGTFHCDQLNRSYSFQVKEDALWASSTKISDTRFDPVVADQFYGSKWQFGEIIYERNAEGQITGFRLYIPEIRNLWFEKILLKNE